MSGIKDKSKKEPEIIQGFKNVPITNLRDVIKKTGDKKYQAKYPIYDDVGDKFLIGKESIITEDRLRKMELENWRNLKVHSKPRYYFRDETTDITFD